MYCCVCGGRRGGFRPDGQPVVGGDEISPQEVDVYWSSQMSLWGAKNQNWGFPFKWCYYITICRAEQSCFCGCQKNCDLCAGEITQIPLLLTLSIKADHMHAAFTGTTAESRRIQLDRAQHFSLQHHPPAPPLHSTSHVDSNCHSTFINFATQKHLLTLLSGSCDLAVKLKLCATFQPKVRGTF